MPKQRKCIIKAADIRKSIVPDKLITKRLRAAGFDTTGRYDRTYVQKQDIYVFTQEVAAYVG